MQIRDQWKQSKNWKVVASVAAASALGISSLALAGESTRTDAPDTIDLDDTTNITQVSTPTSVPTTVADALKLGADTASLDSPFDDSVASASATSPTSPNSPVSPVSKESPASPVSQDSPESASFDSPGSADSD